MPHPRLPPGPLVLGLCAALWEAAPRLGLVDRGLLPPCSRVLLAGVTLARSGELGRHVVASLWRVGLGYGLAVLVAVPLGLAMGLLPPLEQYMRPLLQVLRPIAPPAWVPIAILWFGIGDAPAVFIIALGTGLVLTVGVAAAGRNLDRRLVEAAFTLGASPVQAIGLVVVPSLAPALFAQLRTGLMLAWMCVVAAEMVAVRSGLGYMLIEARSLFQTERVLLGMLVIGALGLMFDQALRALERHVLRWRRGATADELFAPGRPEQELRPEFRDR